MRLRPSGAAGPIASHFTGFARYQRESAWTWEHMALTRARPVAGDAGLRQRISETLEAVLRMPRDPQRLVSDIATMRRRIAEENPRPSPWDLKNRRGGLIDLEFFVQYLILREAASFPEILHRGTAQALVALSEVDALAIQAQRELVAADRLLRDVQAVLVLVSDNMPGAATLPEPDAATLARCVGAVDFTQLGVDISNATARVRSWYGRLVEHPALRAAKETGDNAR
jgi:glutamate-ammonia-ligase adenylyltransferase